VAAVSRAVFIYGASKYPFYAVLETVKSPQEKADILFLAFPEKTSGFILLLRHGQHYRGHNG
jgi:hypothetical protein